MSLSVVIHNVGRGTCSLTGKSSDGFTVSFGRYVNCFLSHKAFTQLVGLELRPEGSPTIPQAAAEGRAKHDAVSSANGVAAEVES